MSKKTSVREAIRIRLDAKMQRALKYFFLLVIVLLALVLAIIILKGKATA